MNRARVTRRPMVGGRKDDKIVLIFGDINTGKTCLEDELKSEDDLSNTTSLLHQGNNYMNRLNYGDKKVGCTFINIIIERQIFYKTAVLLLYILTRVKRSLSVSFVQLTSK